MSRRPSMNPGRLLLAGAQSVLAGGGRAGGPDPVDGAARREAAERDAADAAEAKFTPQAYDCAARGVDRSAYKKLDRGPQAARRRGSRLAAGGGAQPPQGAARGLSAGQHAMVGSVSKAAVRGAAARRQPAVPGQGGRLPRAELRAITGSRRRRSSCGRIVQDAARANGSSAPTRCSSRSRRDEDNRGRIG